MSVFGLRSAEAGKNWQMLWSVQNETYPEMLHINIMNNDKKSLNHTFFCHPPVHTYLHIQL